MRIGPYDGKIKLDDHWFGGREGYVDQFDEYHAQNSWKWTRHFLPQCWYTLAGRVWRKPGAKSGHFRGVLSVNFGWYVSYDIEKIKARRPGGALKIASSIIERDPLRWHLASLGDMVYRYSQTTHVWRQQDDGSWAPFCSTFDKIVSDSWRYTLPAGEYMEVHSDGRMTAMSRWNSGYTCTYGPSNAPALFRWTRYHTPPAPGELREQLQSPPAAEEPDARRDIPVPAPSPRHSPAPNLPIPPTSGDQNA